MTPIRWNRFWGSLRHAGRGLLQALSAENSFRIHVAVALTVTVLLMFLRVPRVELALLILVMASILILELVNTVVERFADLLEPRIHPYVGLLKDFMAAAVLIASVAAVGVGLLILWPHLVDWARSVRLY